MKIGLRVRLQDPDDPTQVINAQFAALRSNPQLGDIVKAIARMDVAESVALRDLQKVAKSFDEDNATQEDLEAARLKADEATETTLRQVHAFVVAGFKLAGASDERAEELASILRKEHRDCEVYVLNGGQEIYSYYIILE